MKDFVKTLILVLAFLLLLAAVITEVQDYFHLSDLGLLFVVMATATVVPAVARPVYIWMAAKNEKDPEAVRKRRMPVVLGILLTAALLIMVRMGMRFFEK